MNKENNQVNTPVDNTQQENKINDPVYPLYHVNEDIYVKSIKEEDIDPEDISRLKEIINTDKFETANEKEFEVDKSGNDLDIPGAELDDEQENIGSEDEENNYYSIGGDNHNGLEEDRGD